MKKTRIVICVVFILLICIVLLVGCGGSKTQTCKHEWKEATCTEPKTCSKCGETDGEVLGHNWQEATCTDPKT